MSARAAHATDPDRLHVRAAIVLSALGYFVDVFDLILLPILRVPSLRDLGAAARSVEVGTLLQNAQIAGLVLGGLVWGVVGDRRGRRAALYASILLYSIATLGSATVTSVPQYVAWRFVAGFGLAGELGAAITLVSELVSPARRGAATALVTMLGVFGATAAALVAEAVPWRMAYVIGGVMGLALLALRVGLRDSPIFTRTRGTATGHGDVRRLVATRERAGRYLRTILVGAPVWYSVGIFVVFAPEFAQALGIEGVTVGRTVLTYYTCSAVGDLACGLLSQALRSRKRAVAAFYALSTVAVAAFLLGAAHAPATFYALCGFMGFAAGFWAVMVTMAAEQFGTDLRATAATSVPAMVRATAIPMTIAFVAMKDALGVLASAAVVGVVVLAIACWALWRQAETYARDLDFVEAP